MGDTLCSIFHEHQVPLKKDEYFEALTFLQSLITCLCNHMDKNQHGIKGYSGIL